jgi:hypothetical protein
MEANQMTATQSAKAHMHHRLMRTPNTKKQSEVREMVAVKTPSAAATSKLKARST